MQRFLLGKPVTLSLAPCDDDGAPIPLDAGGTVSITDGAGVEVDSGDAALSEGGLTLSYEVTPAATVVLARFVLAERLRPMQVVGMVTAIVAAALLALG